MYNVYCAVAIILSASAINSYSIYCHLSDACNIQDHLLHGFLSAHRLHASCRRGSARYVGTDADQDEMAQGNGSTPAFENSALGAVAAAADLPKSTIASSIEVRSYAEFMHASKNCRVMEPEGILGVLLLMHRNCSCWQ